MYIDSWAFGAYLIEKSSPTSNMREAFVTLTEYRWLFSLPYYSYKLPWYLIAMVP